MSAIEQFDLIAWLRQLTPNIDSLDYEVLKPVLSFTLLWNLFETMACDRNANTRAIRSSVDKAYEKRQLHLSDFSKFVEYFRSQYKDTTDIEELKTHLLSGTTQNRSEVQYIRLLSDVLSGHCRNVNDVVFSLLFIAYRIRNNLFHGEKNVFTLSTQVDLFQGVNALLARYLEAINPTI